MATTEPRFLFFIVHSGYIQQDDVLVALILYLSPWSVLMTEPMVSPKNQQPGCCLWNVKHGESLIDPWKALKEVAVPGDQTCR